MDYQPILEVRRGSTVESVHCGAVAVADSAGRLLAWHADPAIVTFLRSSAKPFQALPLLESGAAERFGLDERQLAVICASHTGTDEHVAAVAGIQHACGVSEGDLRCGVHRPYDPPTARRLAETGELPTPNRNNCSGKHTGMLALARHLGAPLEGYLDPAHPVQQRVRAALAALCGLEPSAVAIAIDGCSAPTFAVPLHAAAAAFARLGDPTALPPARAAACRRVFEAMAAHPEMVAGPGRFDSALMRAAAGRIVSKGGAEGYHGLALAPGACGPGSPALGIALKIADGDLGRRTDAPPGQRAGSRAVLAVLRALGALDDQAAEALADFEAPLLTNHRGLPVGEMRACLQLQRTG